MTQLISNTNQFSAAERSQLVEEVRIRACIWRITDKDHANRQRITKAWLEIKALMDTNERQFTGS